MDLRVQGSTHGGRALGNCCVSFPRDKTLKDYCVSFPKRTILSSASVGIKAGDVTTHLTAQFARDITNVQDWIGSNIPFLEEQLLRDSL